jgi:hypothetical protein
MMATKTLHRASQGATNDEHVRACASSASGVLHELHSTLDLLCWVEHARQSMEHVKDLYEVWPEMRQRLAAGGYCANACTWQSPESAGLTLVMADMAIKAFDQEKELEAALSSTRC